MAGATIGQVSGKYGPYDPRKGEKAKYYKLIQKDINKRFGIKGGALKKKGTPTKEK